MHCGTSFHSDLGSNPRFLDRNLIKDLALKVVPEVRILRIGSLQIIQLSYVGYLKLGGVNHISVKNLKKESIL